MKKNTNKQIILLFSLTILLSTLMISNNDDLSTRIDFRLRTPQVGDDAISNPENVTLYLNGVLVDDGSLIYRGIDTLNISFNTTDLGLTYEKYTARLNFSDNSLYNFSLTNTSLHPYIWTGLFTPSISNVTGEATIEILALDAGDNVVNDEGTIDAEIIIKNNAPKIWAHFNDEIYRNENLTVEVFPSDLEDKTFDLEWEVSLFKNTAPEESEILINRGDLTFETDFNITTDYEVGSYTLNVSCWDNENELYNIEYEFSVLDNEPIILPSVFQILYEGEAIELPDEEGESIQIYRNENLVIQLNATDIDTEIDQLRMKISITDPHNPDELSIDEEINPNTVDNWDFSANISIPTTMNIGESELTIKVYHVDDSSVYDSKTYPITIKNNAPILSSIEISDDTNTYVDTDQIEITQGDIITITFQASDVEDGLKYAKVIILYTNPDTDETEEFSYIIKYTGTNTELKIRSTDLPLGTLYIESYVIDENGAESGEFTAFPFELGPKDQTTPVFWLMLVVGLVAGASLSIGIMYASMKRKAERKALLKFERISESSEESLETVADKKAMKEEQEENKMDKSDEKPSNKKRVSRRL